MVNQNKQQRKSILNQQFFLFEIFIFYLYFRKSKTKDKNQ